MKSSLPSNAKRRRLRFHRAQNWRFFVPEKKDHKMILRSQLRMNKNIVFPFISCLMIMLTLLVLIHKSADELNAAKKEISLCKQNHDSVYGQLQSKILKFDVGDNIIIRSSPILKRKRRRLQAYFNTRNGWAPGRTERITHGADHWKNPHSNCRNFLIRTLNLPNLRNQFRSAANPFLLNFLPCMSWDSYRERKYE